VLSIIVVTEHIGATASNLTRRARSWPRSCTEKWKCRL